MKNTFTSSFLGLAISGLLLASCSQMASYENEDLALEQARADKAGFTLSPYGSTGGENAKVYSPEVCSNDCISDDPETWFIDSKEHIFDATDQDEIKKLKIDIYNTPTQLIYDIYTENTTIKYLKIGETFLINNSQSTYYQHIVEIGEYGVDWNECDQYNATFYGFRNNLSGVGGGQLAEIITSYNLVGVCQEEVCEESFTYEDNKDGTYTFTYIPASDIDNAELVFTFAQNSVKSAQDGWEDKGQTYQKTMNLDACQEYNWTFTLDCKDLNNVQNLWTDFKVNDVSKKGGNVNIKCE